MNKLLQKKLDEAVRKTKEFAEGKKLKINYTEEKPREIMVNTNTNGLSGFVNPKWKHKISWKELRKKARIWWF